MRETLLARIVVHVLLAATFLSVQPVAAQEPSPDSPTPDELAAEALAAVEKAEQALARWQKSVKAGAPLRDEDLAKLKSNLRHFGGNIEWLLDHSRQARRAQQNAEPHYRSVGELAQSWIDQMRAIGTGADQKREATIAKLRAALQGDDQDQQYAALKTLQSIGDVNYDKASFRSLVLPLVKNNTGSMLVSACYALYNTDRRPDDLALIQETWNRRSPALDESMSHLLFSFSDGKIEGRSEQIILELLASPHVEVRREALRGLWGASLTDRLAARIIELADDDESHGDAIYYGLSTLKPKNEAVVEKLIETLGDRDWNNWDRALWGLGFGVPEEFQPEVADALAELYAARSDPKTRQKCRDLIGQYAGKQAVEALPNP